METLLFIPHSSLFTFHVLPSPSGEQEGGLFILSNPLDQLMVQGFDFLFS